MRRTNKFTFSRGMNTYRTWRKVTFVIIPDGNFIDDGLEFADLFLGCVRLEVLLHEASSAVNRSFQVILRLIEEITLLVGGIKLMQAARKYSKLSPKMQIRFAVNDAYIVKDAPTDSLGGLTGSRISTWNVRG